MSHNAPETFARHIGIDYSGAKTADAGLPGLRVYQAKGPSTAQEILPPSTHRRKHWSRRGVFEWLANQLTADSPVIIGIDHGFSFPLAYFERHSLPLDWPGFLVDFHAHWPTDAADITVDAVRKGLVGRAAQRGGQALWRRLCEQRTRAKSVFHFDVPGSVAKSTHAGLPWLLKLREQFPETLHFWPFDGWQIPAGKSVIAEIYPSLWSADYPRSTKTPDQHDAFVTATWLSEVDQVGQLTRYLTPDLSSDVLAAAQVEGWILGVL